MNPEDLAQAQLDAYNAHDVDRFLSWYHPDVEVRDFPGGTIRMEGREAMRARYAPLFQNKSLHAELLQRVVAGAVVIDEERVSGLGDELVHAVAIYETEGDSIRRVWFVRSR